VGTRVVSTRMGRGSVGMTAAVRNSPYGPPVVVGVTRSDMGKIAKSGKA